MRIGRYGSDANGWLHSILDLPPSNVHVHSSRRKVRFCVRFQETVIVHNDAFYLVVTLYSVLRLRTRQLCLPAGSGLAHLSIKDEYVAEFS